MPDLSPAASRRTSPTRSADGHALLGRATSRVLYNLDAYRRSLGRAPPRRCGRPRPRDAHQRSRARAARGFSGPVQLFRRLRPEIQHKGQAPPGPVADGWPTAEPLDRQRMDGVQ